MKPIKKAFLNDLGKKEWGDVFRTGAIPILNPFPGTAKLGGHSEKIYLVDWLELSAAEQDAVLEKISNKSGAPKDVIQKEVSRVGLPLRASFVSSVAIDGRLLF